MNGPVIRLDDLDRSIIAALQIDGRASWTDIAERCQTSVTTVSRRAAALLADGTVRVAVVPDINAEGPADLFILRIGCAPAAADRVAQRLVDRRDIRFLAVVTGAADLVAELVVPKEDSLHARLVEELPSIPGVQRCETDLLLHTYKASHQWSRQLLPGDQPAPAWDAEPCECQPSHFDQIDHRIIDVLRADGRASFRAVADRIGVNESTVRRRFETLHDRGCITVITQIPAPALGFESEILLWVTVAPSRLDAVAREMAAHRGIRYVGATLSGSTLMCELIVPTSKDVFGFVTETLGQLDGVQGWTANMQLLTVKRGFVETPWSRRVIRNRAEPSVRLVGSSDS